MESVSVERLDHLGVVVSVIKDLGIIKMIDARLPPHDQEEITTGEAIAGMIVNGLGFANRPLSLTPQFFANKPLDLLFRPGVRADLFNRFTLGRSLDEVSSYGCDLLCNPSCHLLKSMGFYLTLRVKSPISPQEEPAHGRQNYRNVLPV